MTKNTVLESAFSDMIEKSQWSEDDAFRPDNFKALKMILKRSASDTAKAIRAYFEKNPDETWDGSDFEVQSSPDCVFADEEYLGGAVESCQPICTLSPNRKIEWLEQITSDVCGAKFSRLCGFMLKSKVNRANPLFFVVYCPKTRASLTRGPRASKSGWFCWKYVGPRNVVIMDDDAMFSEYKFDLASFLTCDVMKSTLPKFVSQTRHALATVVEKFIKGMPAMGYSPSQVKEAKWYSRQIAEATSALEQEETSQKNDHRYRLKAWRGHEKSDLT